MSSPAKKMGKLCRQDTFWWTRIICVCFVPREVLELWELRPGNITWLFITTMCLLDILPLHQNRCWNCNNCSNAMHIPLFFLFHSLHCVFLFVRYVCGWHKNGVFVIKKCSIRLGTELDKSWENIKTEEEVNFQSSTVLIYSTKYKRRHPTSW